MNLSKLRDGLQHYLQAGLHSPHGPLAELEQLIKALEQKDADLQARLSAETDPTKRHHLSVELEVTRLQHQKGLARRQELLDVQG